MSQLDHVYGAFPGMSGARFYGTGGPNDVAVSQATTAAPTGALNPANTPSPSSPSTLPGKPIVGEPGAGTKFSLHPGSLVANPVTFVVIAIGLAIVLAKYAKDGRIL